MNNRAGRAAAERSYGFPLLEQLRQRTFDQTGRHADDGNGPHPENRTRAVKRYRDRDAGNIAGVAVAITLDGPGAVFWMWAIAIIGMATSLIECSLAQLFE